MALPAHTSCQFKNAQAPIVIAASPQTAIATMTLSGAVEIYKTDMEAYVKQLVKATQVSSHMYVLEELKQHFPNLLPVQSQVYAEVVVLVQLSKQGCATHAHNLQWLAGALQSTPHLRVIFTTSEEQTTSNICKIIQSKGLAVPGVDSSTDGIAQATRRKQELLFQQAFPDL